MSNVTKFDLKNFYNNVMKKDAPLYGYQFYVSFIGADKYGITEDISYYVQSAKIPAFKLDNGKTPFLGTEFRTPGVVKYNNSWACTIFLEEKLTAYKAFRQWQEEISSLSRDGGGAKGIPNVQAKISVLDSSGEHVNNEIFLEGIWVKSVANISLAYANGGGKLLNSFNIDLRYQYNYVSDDPLNA